MKRTVWLMVVCALLIGLFPLRAEAVDLNVAGKSALLMDVATGTVLYEHNAHEALAPASVTKVMTMLLIMEAIDSGKIGWDDTVTTSESAAAKGGSQVYLKAYNVDGPEDYVVLKNEGMTDILLSEYYLTDTEEDPARGGLPSVTLHPGDEFVVYGIKYSGNCVENSVQVSFSWNEEEAIYLFHGTEGLLEKATR